MGRTARHRVHRAPKSRCFGLIAATPRVVAQHVPRFPDTRALLGCPSVVRCPLRPALVRPS